MKQETIECLRQILKDEYGREVSIEEAAQIGGTLIGYFDLLAKIYHREKTENNNNNHDDQRIS